MLKHLVIKNYALIRHLEMSPATGLNIITGETGAGKSIMLGAVGLLLGNRADTRVLYDEEEKCIIEGTFSIGAYALEAFFEEEELDYEADCVIRREISPKGKSRAFINDTPVTLDVLNQLGEALMDIHSQHETLLLGDQRFQLSLLDAYAGNATLLQDYRQAYRDYSKARKALDSLQTEARALQQEAEFNQFQFEELSRMSLAADEQESLEEELQVLENAEEIKRRLNETLEALGRSELSATAHLAAGKQGLQAIRDFSPAYAAFAERLNNLIIEANDLEQEMEREEERVEYDPERTQEVQQRLSEIYRLQQKHGVKDIAALLAIQEDLDAKLQKIGNLDESIAAAEKALETSRQQMQTLADSLSERRGSVMERIVSDLTELLSALGMPDAHLEIKHEQVDCQNDGADRVNILFSANKGLPAQELRKVASGGEFSRLMFCVKYVLADKIALPTIIFDEIDTGISGEIAIKMAAMMQRMARNHQVIAISHLPQIAARGEAHYFVYKDNSQAKTVSAMRRLSEEERVLEIAKMIGGDQPSDTAFQSARELMAG